MRKLLLIFLSIIIMAGSVAGPVSAQFLYDNQVGLYTTSDGLGATGTNIMGEAVNVYLVLTQPRDVENGNAPFTACQGFELSIHFSPVPNNNLFPLAMNLPPDSVDIGENKDINQGFLDFVVGVSLDSPVPVVDAAVQLIEFTFINFNPGMTAVSLTPYGPTNSIPGEMAFLGNRAEDLRVMHSKGGSHDAAVFIFNGMAVPVEIESFGSVKSLYR